MNSSEPTPDPIDLADPGLYLNRELSLLEFHKRVVARARTASTPLLERLRYLTISSAILDEFFEIRVSGLKEQTALDLSKSGPDGLLPQETLVQIRGVVTGIVDEQYRILNEELLPGLRQAGVDLVSRKDWKEKLREWARAHFEREVLPVLTPVGLDPAHPFPRTPNRNLNFIVTLSGRDAFGRSGRIAVLQVPRILPRVIPVPPKFHDSSSSFVLLSSVIREFVSSLFPGMKVTACHQFRVTRNSELWVDEEEVRDLLSALKGELPRRHFGKAVRLEVSRTCPPDLVTFLLEQFEMTPDDLYRVEGPVNLHRLEAMIDAVDRPDLKFRPYLPGLSKKTEHTIDVFATLRRGDLFLHHPYQSFGPVIDMLNQAADDPDVLAIKLTIYRTGLDSPIARALIRAAEAGKEVTAVVELRARFDEAANIDLASRLQEAGANVVYGVVGFKAHCKMLLVVRSEGNRLRRYVHLGTGNYNARTARLYSDFGLMTADPEISQDVHEIFQQLTGLGKTSELLQLVQTPFRLRQYIIELIDREIRNAESGKESAIKAKVNSLVDRPLIEALYRASMAGVPVDLIVRGTCCLRPGVPGVSENIRVRSIVGRFLEHHRVFCFHNAGDPEVLAGSADWMPRNLSRRVEVCFPLRRKKIRQRAIFEGLDVYLRDNQDAWLLRSDGSYEPVASGDAEAFSAQEHLLGLLAQVQG